MYTLDANVFLRDLDPRHADTDICCAVLDHLQRSATPVIVPTLVLAEVAGAVSRELRDPIHGRLAATVLWGLPHLVFVSIDDAVAQDAANLAADYAIRGADAVYVAVARQHRTTLVSLDREVRERAARAATTMSPHELLERLTLPPQAS